MSSDNNHVQYICNDAAALVLDIQTKDVDRKQIEKTKDVEQKGTSFLI
jgi:hypothetical protein